MVSFLILVVIVGGLFAAFLGARRLGASRRSSAVEAGVVIATGKFSQVQLTQQALKVAGVWSLMRDVSSTAYSMPQDFQLWVKAKDAERARDALGIDPEP